MIMRRDVFQAIAAPARRAVLGIIAHKSLNINAVTEQFDVSRAKGDQTGIIWQMLFESAELSEALLKTHKANKGINEKS